MRIACGFDHAGFPLKPYVLEVIRNQGHEALDLGADSPDPVDYPIIALRVVRALKAGKADRGVLVCGSGAGVAVAAGKIDGIRAVSTDDTYTARQAVEHDNVNVICFGARVIGPALAEDIVTSFLNAEFDGAERYKRRLDQIALIERDGLDAHF